MCQGVSLGLASALSFAGLGVFRSIGPTLIGDALGVDSLGVRGAVVAIVMAMAAVTTGAYFASTYAGLAVPSVVLGVLADASGQRSTTVFVMGVVGVACLAVIGSGLGRRASFR